MRVSQIVYWSIWAQILHCAQDESLQASRFQKRISQTDDRSNAGFVYTRGDGNLYLKGKLFNFRNFNAPTIFVGGEYQCRDLLKSVAGFGAPVTRTYTLQIANDKFEYGRLPSSGSHIIGWDEFSNDWEYNESQWQKMDQVMELSRLYGVKLIIPIINQDYANPDSDYVGTFVDLIRHRYKIYEYRAAGNKIDFFTDRNMIDAYKQLITFFLNRINTFNGIRYGEDNTILAFETGNELSWSKAGRGLSPPPANWTIEIAQHLKSLAPRTLVMDGSYSRDPSVAWQTAVLESTHVDLFSYHFYGGGDTLLYDALNSKIRTYGKALVIGEHGFYSDVGVYRKIYRKMTCAGALVWALLPHSEKGGFLTHSEGHNVFGYHVPGWQMQSSKEFDTHEAEVIASTYDASYRILGLEPPSKPAPGRPEAFIVTNGTHAGLSWRGAAWAAGYEILGAEAWSHRFHLISDVITDNLEAGELFVPLDPENPTESIRMAPRETRPRDPHQGWIDTKWDWISKAIDHELSIVLEDTDAALSMMKRLPSMQPMRRHDRGRWYSVRAISADGVHGSRSNPVFLKADWENKQRG